MKAEEIHYETPLTNSLFHRASQRKIPLSGTFEVSPMCNFDCKMCYVRLSKEQVESHSRKMLTLDQWKRLADEAEKKGLLYLLIGMLPSYRTMKYKSPIWGYFRVQKE